MLLHHAPGRGSLSSANSLCACLSFRGSSPRPRLPILSPRRHTLPSSAHARRREKGGAAVGIGRAVAAAASRGSSSSPVPSPPLAWPSTRISMGCAGREPGAARGRPCGAVPAGRPFGAGRRRESALASSASEPDGGGSEPDGGGSGPDSGERARARRRAPPPPSTRGSSPAWSFAEPRSTERVGRRGASSSPSPLSLSLRPWRRQAAEVGHGGGLRRLGSSTAGGMPRTHAGPAPRQPIQTLATRAGSSARRTLRYHCVLDREHCCGRFSVNWYCIVRYRVG